MDQVPDQVTVEFFDSENANKGGVTLSVADAEALFALVDPLEGVCDATSFSSIAKWAMFVEEAMGDGGVSVRSFSLSPRRSI